MMKRFRYIAPLVFVIGVFAKGTLATPTIQHWQSENGLQVYFVPAPEIPMIDMRLVFDAGSSRDSDLPGLAAISIGLMDEGSGDWNADDIANRFENVGAVYSASLRRDMATISLRSLSAAKYLDSALETFVAVITSPSFPNTDFLRLKNMTRVTLQAQEEDPASIAEKAFYRAIYGDHPFANPINGTPAAIEAITLQDVKKYYQRYIVARNAVLAIVGDIDRAHAEAVAAKIGKGLSAGEPAADLAAVKALQTGQLIRIPFPSKQAHVYLGQPGIRRDDPDYFPLYLGNHILGGSGFNSRLVKEVRVKRGLSYSVYSYFLPQSKRGPFEVVLQTRTDQADEAAALAKKTIAQFVEHGPSEVELEASIKNITGGFPLRIDSNSDIVAYLAVIGFYDLPLDYLDTFNDKIKLVSRQAIQQAFKKRLHIDKMVTVIVGGDSEKKVDFSGDG
jgi:zinc protease